MLGCRIQEKGERYGVHLGASDYCSISISLRELNETWTFSKLNGAGNRCLELVTVRKALRYKLDALNSADAPQARATKGPNRQYGATVL